MLERPIIVALDFSDPKVALTFADSLDPRLCRVKVGFELFVAGGPGMVEALVDRGFDVFLDLKFHDIPNTVASACRAAAKFGVWMMNVHASGGRAMLNAAREALESVEGRRPLLIAVTVLTSMDDADLAEMGVTNSAADQVVGLARLTRDCGLDGVVCSAAEALRLRGELSEDFKLVTPGIRPADSDRGDQKRIVTPADALRMGADYLVIGRPITQAPDPLARLRQISGSLGA